jgi:tellurite resistance protein TerC
LGCDSSRPEIATETSLAVIVVVLLVTTIASIVKTRRDPAARAHAGALRHRREASVEASRAPGA